MRENQLAAIVRREESPTGLAFRRMFPFMFKNHPYGFLQQGDPDAVKKFTTADAKHFWSSQITRPWVLAVSGDFNKEKILTLARQLPVPSEKATTLETPAWGQEKKLELKLPGRNQAHLMMVFPTSGAGAPDEPGLALLQNILAGQSGLLFRDLRDVHGLGYSVTALAWKGEKAGALIFYIGTEPAKLAQAEAGFERIIAQLHSTPLPEEELMRGKQQMTGDYYRDHQSLASRSSEAAKLTLLNRPLDAERAIVDTAQKITAEELQELSRKYIQKDRAYFVKVLP